MDDFIRRPGKRRPSFGKVSSASQQRPETFITPAQAADADSVRPTPVGVQPAPTGYGSQPAASPADALKQILDKNKTTPGDKAYHPKTEVPKPKRTFPIPLPKTRQGWINVSLIAVVFLGLLGGGAFLLFGSDKPANNAVAPPPVAPPPPAVATPTTVPSKLSGLPVAPEVNNRPVTAVMVENSPDARPQSGIIDASVVFEAIAEGGITRFALVYQDTQPDYIGPIRSVRPYYLDWIWPFDASLAHVGGAPQALKDIQDLKIRDLDQFRNAGSYTRVSSRYAPHNVYSSIAKFNELEHKVGWGTSTFTPFERKNDSPAAAVNAKSIDVKISSALYNSHYDYDAGSNKYLRKQAGQVHKDERSGAQLQPKVVVAIEMRRGIAADGQHTEYTTVGAGKMLVFQDGTVQPGTWRKAGRKDQWKFEDANGQPFKFNAGQTWFTMVDSVGLVSYKP